jgi:hypothetical protein
VDPGATSRVASSRARRHGGVLDYSLWNGSYTQSGSNVTVTNTAYSGAVPAGGSTTFGFTATDSGSDASPASVT